MRATRQRARFLKDTTITPEQLGSVPRQILGEWNTVGHVTEVGGAAAPAPAGL
jgi:hypothetical protein